MSIDEAPLTEDTPEAVVADTPETTDWQKRYSDLQPEYTRATQALREAEGVWDDEEAVRQRLRDKFGWDLQDAADDDDDLDEDDTPGAQELAEIKAEQQAQKEWRAERDSEKALERFENDLKAEAGDNVPQQGRDWIYQETIRLGDGRDNLKKAVAAWTEFEETHAKAVIERLKKSKKAPHIPAGGTTATDTKNVADMSRQELNQHMVERAEALGAQ